MTSQLYGDEKTIRNIQNSLKQHYICGHITFFNSLSVYHFRANKAKDLEESKTKLNKYNVSKGKKMCKIFKWLKKL